MEQRIIENIAGKRGIGTDAVIREYYEYLVLKDIYDSSIGDKIVFKGGTALRIFYRFPRYSDDLDFDMKKIFGFTAFKKTLLLIAKKYPAAAISDIWNKRNTYICELKIKEAWQATSFSLKIEVSKRKNSEKKEIQLKLAESEDFRIQVFGNVYGPATLYKDKLKALEGRDEPKDYFDLWCLSQLLKTGFKPGKSPDKKRYKQTLGKYLPLKYRKILDEIL